MLPNGRKHTSTRVRVHIYRPTIRSTGFWSRTTLLAGVDSPFWLVTKAPKGHSMQPFPRYGESAVVWPIQLICWHQEHHVPLTERLLKFMYICQLPTMTTRCQVMAMAAHVEYVLQIPRMTLGRSVHGSISGSLAVPNRQSKVEEHNVSAHLCGLWTPTLVRI